MKYCYGESILRLRMGSWSAYVVADYWLLRCHAIEEAVHRLHEFLLVVRDPGFNVQRVERHLELFS